jgi:hypothetical protein
MLELERNTQRPKDRRSPLKTTTTVNDAIIKLVGMLASIAHLPKDMEVEFGAELVVTPPNGVKGFPRLWRDKFVSEESPVVKGTWITVDHIVSLIVEGCSWNNIMWSYPELTEDDIRAALSYSLETEPEAPKGLTEHKLDHIADAIEGEEVHFIYQSGYDVIDKNDILNVWEDRPRVGRIVSHDPCGKGSTLIHDYQSGRPKRYLWSKMCQVHQIS